MCKCPSEESSNHNVQNYINKSCGYQILLNSRLKHRIYICLLNIEITLTI